MLLKSVASPDRCGGRLLPEAQGGTGARKQAEGLQGTVHAIFDLFLDHLDYIFR